MDSKIITDINNILVREGVDVNSDSFKEWFGNSRVRNGDEPVLLFHGTNAVFDTFDIKHAGEFGDKGLRGKGVYLTPNIGTAKRYGSTVLYCYARLINPFEPEKFKTADEICKYLGIDESMFQFDENTKEFRIYGTFANTITAEIKGKGHDGVIYNKAGEVVVFDAKNILIVSKT